MTGLALAILIAQGVALLWDLLEPDAIKVKLNSPARGVLAVAISVSVLVLLLNLVAASAAVCAFVVCAVVVALAIQVAR